MKLLFLDVYKKSFSRISKDTAGGYGTENDLGDGIFGKSLSFIVKNLIFWPNLSFVQLMQEFKNLGHSVKYKKHVGSYTHSGEWDAIFICSSIVCFETELLAVNNILKKQAVPIFLCGSFPQFSEIKIPKGATMLSGNYEFLPQKLLNEDQNLLDLAKKKFIAVAEGNSDELGQIEWSSMNLPKNKNMVLGKGKSYIPFLTSRGCPYSCKEYCTYPTTQGSKVRRQSNDESIKKLKSIATEFPNSHVVFRDPVFSLNIKETKELLKKIIISDINLSFSAELHLRNIDDEFIDLCKEANFSGLKFGIESALPEVRDSVKRFSVTNDVQKQMISKINRAGLKSIGMFILAQPEDTEETCNKTIDYACSLDLSVAQFSIFTPYPGTPFYYGNRKLIRENRFENFNQYSLVFKHDSISSQQARNLLEKSYKRFLFSKGKKKMLSIFTS